MRALREALGAELLNVEEFRGDLALTVARGAWVKAATLLRDHPELDYKLFLDLCGVDHLDKRSGPSASRWSCTRTRSRTSTTCA